jgi:hypothetical protein
VSPIDKDGHAKVIMDADSFFRDHRGLLAMGHLIAMIAAIIGVMFSVTSIFGFIVRYDDWPTMGQYGVALLMAGAGLEYGQTNLEARRK